MRRPLAPSRSLDRRQLDTPFFEQALDLVLQLNPLPDQLQASARHAPPDALLRLGDETQHQFARRKSPDQTFRVGCIRLAALGSLVGLSLRQMQPQVGLQRHPYRLPVLRGRLHHHFHHPMLL